MHRHTYITESSPSFFLRARPEGMLPPRPGVAAAAASPPADEEELRLGHGHAQGPGKGPERSSCSGVPSAAVHLNAQSPQKCGDGYLQLYFGIYLSKYGFFAAEST